MSFDNEAIFTKENLDGYLKELAKAFRKRNGTSMPAEIILVGGAAILVNYGFRAMTTDIDAIIHAASSMKDAINEVGNRHDLVGSIRSLRRPVPFHRSWLNIQCIIGPFPMCCKYEPFLRST